MGVFLALAMAATLTVRAAPPHLLLIHRAKVASDVHAPDASPGLSGPDRGLAAETGHQRLDAKP